MDSSGLHPSASSYASRLDGVMKSNTSRSPFSKGPGEYIMICVRTIYVRTKNKSGSTHSTAPCRGRNKTKHKNHLAGFFLACFLVIRRLPADLRGTAHLYIYIYFFKFFRLLLLIRRPCRLLPIYFSISLLVLWFGGTEGSLAQQVPRTSETRNQTSRNVGDNQVSKHLWFVTACLPFYLAFTFLPIIIKYDDDTVPLKSPICTPSCLVAVQFFLLISRSFRERREINKKGTIRRLPCGNRTCGLFPSTNSFILELNIFPFAPSSRCGFDVPDGRDWSTRAAVLQLGIKI